MVSRFRLPGIVVTALILGLVQPATPQNPLPPDPAPTCVVTPAEFKGWFAGGNVTLNGLVNPADSVGFVPNSTCAFYKWSEQMFLWLTSPDHKYGGSGHVFDSPVFYQVSPPENGKRTLVPFAPGRVLNFAVRQSQVNNRGKQLVVRPDGKVTEVEEGQAGGNGTLMSQGGSLVYYAAFVNDVYAEFLTGVKSGKIPSGPTTTFPDTQAELNQVIAFATTQGKKLADAKALALEIKTSWVDLATIPAAKKANYVTIKAVVPDYDKSNPAVWKPKGTHQVTLALVGMHIVGAVQGHPEMVWATFEQEDNAPNDTYTYTNKLNQPVSKKLSTNGPWVFMKSGAGAPFNVENMKFDPATGNIVATPGHTVSPSNTVRNNPWGDGTVNGVAATNNTQIIALNESVIGQLLAGDVRKHYVHIGTTWTNGKIPGVDPDPVPIIGSQTLANTTMETYNQTLNCFICHSGGRLDGLSHIYGALQPLPLKK